MPVMESRLSMMSLGVKDLKVSRRFYSEGLGFVERQQTNEFIVFYDLGAMTLSLYPEEKLAAEVEMPANGEGFRGFTLSHNLRTEAGGRRTTERCSFSGSAIDQKGLSRRLGRIFRLFFRSRRVSLGGGDGLFPRSSLN